MKTTNNINRTRPVCRVFRIGSADRVPSLLRRGRGWSPLLLLRFFLLILLISFSSLTYPQLKSIDAGRVTDNTFNCDFCMCSQGISPLDFSGKGIRLDPRYLVIDRMVKDGKTIDNTEGSYEKHFTLQASVIYPVGRKFSVIGVLPYSVREGRESRDEKIIHTSGPGDAILFGRYLLLEKNNGKNTILLST